MRRNATERCDLKRDGKPNQDWPENGMNPYKVLTTKFDSLSKAKKLKNRETNLHFQISWLLQKILEN